MQNFLVELPDMRVLTVSGPQQAEYLHGQITIDTKQFDSNYARIAAHCDFKGKMWSVLYLTQAMGAYNMVMPADSAAASYEQLKKYGVFSKVEIELHDESLYVFGAAGDTIKDKLLVLFPNLSEKHLSVTANEFGQVITFNDENLRFLLILPQIAKKRISELCNDHIINDSNAWSILEVNAGIGMLAKDNIAEFIPQMLNLQALNAIDFDKGCYMGQEVVARTKFLGKNKRALYILQANHDITEPVSAGELLEKSIGENWRRGGTIIQCATYNGQTRLLAVLSNDSAEGDILRVKASEDEFTVLALPYSLEID